MIAIIDSIMAAIISVSPPTKDGFGNLDRQLVFYRILDATPNGILNTNKILLVLNFFHEF
jgi:hypothetical protein